MNYQDSPNRSTGLVNPPWGIVIHFIAGSYTSGVNTLTSPNSGVSAHYVVGKQGQAVQLVPLPGLGGPQDGKYKAWHVRSQNPNYIGIEHEGFGAVADWTDALLDASAAITALCCQTYGIPVAGPPGACGVRPAGFHGILGHCNVPANDHSDPGPNFPWAAYLDRVRAHMGGASDVTAEEHQRLVNAEFSAGAALQKIQDVEHKVDQILAQLAAGVGGGASPSQVDQVVRNIFKDAGTP